MNKLEKKYGKGYKLSKMTEVSKAFNHHPTGIQLTKLDDTRHDKIRPHIQKLFDFQSEWMEEAKILGKK